MEKTVSACGTGNSGSITATRAGTGLSAHLAEAVTVSSADGTTDVALNAPVIITTGTGHVVSVQVTPPHGCVAHGSFNATGTQWTSATTLGATSTYTRAPNRVPVGCAPESSVSKPTSHAICVTCEASEGAACGPAVELSLTVALRHGKLHSQCNGGVALPAGSRVFSAVMRVGQADVAEPFCVGDS